VGHYEPGAFDIRGPRPRRTALGALVAGLAKGVPLEDPVSADPGWWRRPGRFLHPFTETPALAAAEPPALAAVEQHSRPAPAAGASAEPAASAAPKKPAPFRGEARPVLITGARGTLGRALMRVCDSRGIAHVAFARPELDIADGPTVDTILENVRPWAVLNAAGYVRVDEAENEPEQCLRENADGPSVLAEACARRRLRFLTLSTDLVFDGNSRRPYLESDPVSPLNVYGRSKAEAERRIARDFPDSQVIRTSSFFGTWDDHNFLLRCLAAFRKGESVMAADDLIVSPTYVPDLAHACLDLLLDGETGVWHLANTGAISWAGLARYAAGYIGIKEDSVIAMPSRLLFPAALRPRYSVLGSERGWMLPSLEHSLDDCLADLKRRKERLADAAPALVF
jgi:dTDP-4-dehydrorhamnose reductase